ncbi:hypothetical protein BV22DRAFT_1051159 [Leucogyrophana mollusca]|uniref:Uncharacterized protein n=1 Tax=Leucogyrophana mollusca TaxID=85980 RepID=A0ACB8B179_9AGAM|nr:hypothetical protein BV22DRAFT_1051159 [Leucogyrophana mollusca]
MENKRSIRWLIEARVLARPSVLALRPCRRQRRSPYHQMDTIRWLRRLQQFKYVYGGEKKESIQSQHYGEPEAQPFSERDSPMRCIAAESAFVRACPYCAGCGHPVVVASTGDNAAPFDLQFAEISTPCAKLVVHPLTQDACLKTQWGSMTSTWRKETNDGYFKNVGHAGRRAVHPPQDFWSGDVDIAQKDGCGGIERFRRDVDVDGYSY